MHSYYLQNKEKILNQMNENLSMIRNELSEKTGKSYEELFAQMRDYYETQLLERFPYIGGDDVSGTKNLVEAYMFVAMGKVLENYGVSVEESGHLMVICYERMMLKMPSIARKVMGKFFTSEKLLKYMMKKKDARNAKNAAENPGSFVTETQDIPEEGYDFSYHNLVCPLSAFAKQYGYEEYMPYLCNLDYVMFGALNAPLYREHTCFEDGDYCDFKLKKGAEIMKPWPPVFQQGKGFK